MSETTLETIDTFLARMIAALGETNRDMLPESLYEYIMEMYDYCPLSMNDLEAWLNDNVGDCLE